MIEPNAKLVQDAYAAFGRGDIPAVLAMMTPDVTIGIVGRRSDAPFLGLFSGLEGAGEFFSALDAAHEISAFEPLRFAAAEDMVFIWGRYRWRMRRSGVADETEWLHVITIRDGKLAKWLGHNDTAMLAQAYHAAPVKRAVNG